MHAWRLPDMMLNDPKFLAEMADSLRRLAERAPDIGQELRKSPTILTGWLRRQRGGTKPKGPLNPPDPEIRDQIHEHLPPISDSGVGLDALPCLPLRRPFALDDLYL